MPSSPEPDRDVTALTRSIDALVRAGWRSEARQALLAAAGVDLNATDTDTIWDLDANGPSRPQHIAARVRIGAPSITKAVARLSEAGLVQSTRDESDGRAQVLSLTSEGHRVAAILHTTSDAIVAGMTSDWTPAEVAEFTRLATRLAAASATWAQ